ncbi:MAG: purple acid phosphatase family protein [Planctomycetota bacterium]
MHSKEFCKSSQPSRSLLTSPLWFLFLVLVIAFAGCARIKKGPPLPRVSEEQAVVDFVRITKGPFLLRVAHNEAALMWETDKSGPGKVCYGSDKQLKNHIVVGPERIEYQVREIDDIIHKKEAFIYKTWLTNLQPGKLYYYQVATAQTQSRIYSFHTIPADAGEVNFVVYGDGRSYPTRHRRIVEQIISRNVDFVVITGDLVEDGEVYQQWQSHFFEPLKGLAESVPIYALKGNHDLSEQNYFEKLLVPPGQTANFTLDYGNVHYYCADN